MTGSCVFGARLRSLGGRVTLSNDYPSDAAPSALRG